MKSLERPHLPAVSFWAESKRSRLLLGIVASLLGTGWLVSLLTYNANDPSWNHIPATQSVNSLQALSANIADFSVQAFGRGAYLMSFLLVCFGLLMLVRRRRPMRWIAFAGFTFVSLLSSPVLHLFLGQEQGRNIVAGGFWGHWFHSTVQQSLGKVGSVSLLLGIIVLSVMWLVGFPFGYWLDRLGAWLLPRIELAGRSTLAALRTRFKKRGEENDELELFDDFSTLSQSLDEELPALNLEGAWLPTLDPYSRQLSWESLPGVSPEDIELPGLTPHEMEAVDTANEMDELLNVHQRPISTTPEHKGFKAPNPPRQNSLPPLAIEEVSLPTQSPDFAVARVVHTEGFGYGEVEEAHEPVLVRHREMPASSDSLQAMTDRSTRVPEEDNLSTIELDQYFSFPPEEIEVTEPPQQHLTPEIGSQHSLGRVEEHVSYVELEPENHLELDRSISQVSSHRRAVPHKSVEPSVPQQESVEPVPAEQMSKAVAGLLDSFVEGEMADNDSYEPEPDAVQEATSSKELDEWGVVPSFSSVHDYDLKPSSHSTSKDVLAAVVDPDELLPGEEVAARPVQELVSVEAGVGREQRTTQQTHNERSSAVSPRMEAPSTHDVGAGAVTGGYARSNRYTTAPTPPRNETDSFRRERVYRPVVVPGTREPVEQQDSNTQSWLEDSTPERPAEQGTRPRVLAVQDPRATRVKVGYSTSNLSAFKEEEELWFDSSEEPSANDSFDDESERWFSEDVLAEYNIESVESLDAPLKRRQEKSSKAPKAPKAPESRRAPKVEPAQKWKAESSPVQIASPRQAITAPLAQKEPVKVETLVPAEESKTSQEPIVASSAVLPSAEHDTDAPAGKPSRIYAHSETAALLPALSVDYFDVMDEWGDPVEAENEKKKEAAPVTQADPLPKESPAVTPSVSVATTPSPRKTTQVTHPEPVQTSQNDHQHTSFVTDVPAQQTIPQAAEKPAVESLKAPVIEQPAVSVETTPAAKETLVEKVTIVEEAPPKATIPAERPVTPVAAEKSSAPKRSSKSNQQDAAASFLRALTQPMQKRAKTKSVSPDQVMSSQRVTRPQTSPVSVESKVPQSHVEPAETSAISTPIPRPSQVVEKVLPRTEEPMLPSFLDLDSRPAEEPAPVAEVFVEPVAIEPSAPVAETTQAIVLANEVEPAAEERKPIVIPRHKIEAEEIRKKRVKAPWQVHGYEPPDLEFLDYEEPSREDEEDSIEFFQRNARILEDTLASFNVQGEVKAILPGPVITMYEYLPEPGIKVSKIANLADDLAMALAAISVRVIAPIPGKGVIGIELPNKRREMVYLRELLAHEDFAETKHPLPMAMGKDITGKPFIANLAKMPHILIAGTTGSGKSVGVNGMICSLLYHCSPEEVRFLMVDPKMLELSIYNGIPHLLLPVVTDPKKAAVALNWAVAEMERRYALMAEAGVRGIGKYNDLIKRRQRVRDWHRQREQEADATRRAALGADIWDEEDEILDVADVQKQSDEGDYFEKLPYIVVIIDELADLMMVASKDVEISIARLAQKARAAGIHLMVATQRPSVDVLTGMIKANFPARLAFQLKSKIDSRTILDAMGAERLLGMGDMLLIPPGRSNPVRLHGPYISEEEIHQIVKHLKTQGEPDYKDEILAGGLDEEEDEDGFDALYDQALEFVVQSRKASANALQKEFKIGNSRASRLIDQLEEQGIIGPKNGTKPRDILLPPPGEDLLL